MANPSNLNDIIQRILNGNQTDDDVEALRQWLNSGGSQNLQVGKYNINIGQGQDIHIGDRTYQGLDAEAIREVARAVIQGSNAADIREVVRSILKEEFQNLAQRENPQSSSRKTILVLASSPTYEARLRLDKQMREIDEGLRRSQQREKFTLQQRWAVRPDDLRRALLDFNPEIIHFCGHGSGDDRLVLQDDAGKAQLVPTEALANLFKRFARAFPQVQVVVTCRTQSQESRFERFDYVEVADFNEEQVRAFAVHWFGTVCADAGKRETKAREFLEQLFREENKPIRELAITPILLSLTCAVFHQTGKFYSKRSKLYEEGLELLLVQWDKSREVERGEIYQDLSVERKLELLSYVAVKKFEQQQYVLFEQEELEGYIGEFLGIERRDSRGVLQAIASQHGLLIERAQKVWSFSHLTFQEYLVAYYVSQSDSNIEQLIAENLDRRRYREVFLLILSLTLNPEESIVFMKTKVETYYYTEVLNFLQWNNKIIHKSDISIQSSAKCAIAIFLATTFISLFSFNISFETCESCLNIALALDSNLKYALSHIPGFVDTSTVHFR